MHKAVFLDRDGTINVEKNYIYQIEDFQFLPGVIEGLRILQSLGYELIIITNQSGIGRGYYTETDYQKLNRWMIEELERYDIHIKNSYYCPHLPDAKIEKYRIECNCRKPRLGMFHKAIEENDIDVNQSIAIGDKERDLEICKNGRTRGFLIYNREEDASGNISLIKNGVLEVAKILQGEGEQKNDGLDVTGN